MIIINSDFIPILETIRQKLDTVKTLITIVEDESQPDTKLTPDAEYEDLLNSVSSSYAFEDLDENTKATTFYTTGTTGKPKGVYFTHRQLMLHTLSVAITYG